MLSSAIQEVNRQQTQANESVQGMVSGKNDIHTTMVAMEKAGISFRLMLAARKKMIAAYEEVMRRFWLLFVYSNLWLLLGQ
jgi:flagellar hook-basal body complex protein FliE